MPILALLALVLAPPAPELHYARQEDRRIDFVAANLDGGEGRVLGSLTLDEGEETLGLALAPDGRRAFLALFGADGRSRLVRFEYNGERRDLVTQASFDDIVGLDVAPDGRTLAFGAVSDGPLRLAVIGTDGAGLRRLAPDGHGANPAFDGTGGNIAYEALVPDPNRPEIQQSTIWTIATAGGEPRRLTPFGLRAQTPAWSPDGARVLYRATPGGIGTAFDLRHTGADGRGPMQLFRDLPAAMDMRPFFHPDGATLWLGYTGEGLFSAPFAGGELSRRVEEPLGLLAAKWIRR
jgi:dipeptidyl aminopeptidase/acylaminoacyl peptidase